MIIALIGYGKMGKAIEEIVLAEGNHTIRLKITEENLSEFTINNLQSCDVAIDFTQPETAYDNVMKCFEANIPVVVGTTSWDEGLSKAKSYCIEHKKTLFSSPNFSIGVNLFFKLNEQLAQMMSNHQEYRLSMSEIHHTEKKDAPSGTAIQLAKDIIGLNLNHTSWSLDQASSEQDIAIEAIRSPHVPGTHHVKYESEIDYIQISHEAKGRKGFAIGALRAAEYIYDKTGYFTMKDLLNF